ncbi:sugar diacid recognition domain-containing protein [Mycobacterium sp. URHB0044]|jgi:carbohydrate diacid regulator|uniref:CdaR family transcriptional regulator n=1 Tax=Mycobacterium sp. URHB0044 TaxID=1380386 RepID=UPI00068670ED|nr:sugar diacid recognition domain-containing protein [Mycobacterium sp. URHB0044]
MSTAGGDGDQDSHPLTSALAQRVVDQVRPRLTHGINVMDHTGRIIGSVDSTRIGSVHDGAVRAISECRTVVIDTADDAAGVKPGVNIPLLLDGAVIGVVGVTGDPAEVEPIGAVIALTVELLVNDERQRDSSRWHEDAVRQVLLTLASGAMSEEGLLEALEHLGSPLSPPWNLSAVISARTSGWTMPPEQLATLLRRIEGIPNAIAAELQGALWVLNGSAGARSLSGLRNRLRAFKVRIITGRLEATTEQVAIEAKQLRVLLSAAGLLPKRDVVWLGNVAVECAVASQPTELSQDLVDRVLAPLSPPLRETARRFLDEDLSIAATAKGLATHRNTLVQRLDRIEQLTGLDLRRFGHATTMKLALLAADART